MLDNHHSHYDDVQLAELTLSADGKRLLFPCPCGDEFSITLAQLESGHHIAQCPTCSLTIYVQYESVARAIEHVHSLVPVAA
jgi:diphthamide biosynthesis protein 3